MFSAKEFPPQYFFMSGIFRVLVIIFAPFVSRIVMPLVRVFDNSAALQTLKHLCKSNIGILSSSLSKLLILDSTNDLVSHQQIFKIAEVKGRR